ncbi:MAG: YitT family protein [Candidatus Izemoplasmatales bacterium]
MKKFKKPLIYMLGLSILGFSVTLFQKSNLGMGSWDALNRNFYEGIPLDYRYLTPIMAMILISLAYLIEKKKPNLMMLFPLVISFYIGLVIDVLLLVIPDVTQLSILYNITYVFLALILVAIALNMIVLCDYPLPALDQFCLAIARRFKITFGKGKLIGEALALVAAIIVGLAFSHEEQFFFLGPNTAIALVFIGIFVDFFAKPIKKILGDMNDYRNIR